MNSLRTRLFGAIVLVVVLSIGISLAIGSVLTRRAVDRSSLAALTFQADLIGEKAKNAVSPLQISVRSFEDRLAEQDEQPLIVGVSLGSPYLPAPALKRVRAGKPAHGRVTVDGTDSFFAAYPVNKQQALVLIRPTHAGNSYTPYLEALVIGGLMGMTLAAAVAFWLARRIARPVGRVAEAARKLPDASVPEPLPVEGPTEMRSLAASFNDTAVQLERARAAERQFLLSVSHELKTPLTAIRGYNEALRDGAVGVEETTETIAREAERLERLIRDLLDLARMNKSEFSVHTEPIDLAVAAEETVRRYEPAARGFGVDLEAVADAPAPANGDTDRILQVVGNLVENALRITPSGGRVRVGATPGEITVEDTGPGLRAEELPHVFERFYLHERYGRERSVGTGLGLAIVKELAEGMGGSVSVESEPGRGTRFRVRLPSAPRPAARAGEPALSR
jgi:two-component system sensor histidine kinase BaeS